MDRYGIRCCCERCWNTAHPCDATQCHVLWCFNYFLWQTYSYASRWQ